MTETPDNLQDELARLRAENERLRAQVQPIQGDAVLGEKKFWEMSSTPIPSTSRKPWSTPPMGRKFTSASSRWR